MGFCDFKDAIAFGNSQLGRPLAAKVKGHHSSYKKNGQLTISWPQSKCCYYRCSYLAYIRSTNQFLVRHIVRYLNILLLAKDQFTRDYCHDLAAGDDSGPLQLMCTKRSLPGQNIIHVTIQRYPR